MEYTARRDHFIDFLADEFQLELTPRHDVPAWQGCEVYTATDKIISADNEKQIFGRTRYFSFVPPSSGMFIWVYFTLHTPLDRVLILYTDEDQLPGSPPRFNGE